jgi:hypothetical protein
MPGLSLETPRTPASNRSPRCRSANYFARVHRFNSMGQSPRLRPLLASFTSTPLKQPALVAQSSNTNDDIEGNSNSTGHTPEVAPIPIPTPQAPSIANLVRYQRRMFYSRLAPGGTGAAGKSWVGDHAADDPDAAPFSDYCTPSDGDKEPTGIHSQISTFVPTQNSVMNETLSSSRSKVSTPRLPLALGHKVATWIQTPVLLQGVNPDTEGNMLSKGGYCTIQYESPRTFNRLWIAGPSLSIEAATAMKIPSFHSPVSLRHCGLSVHPYWSRAQVANEIAAFAVAIDIAKAFNAAAKPYRCELKLSTAVHLVDTSIQLPVAARQSHSSLPALQDDVPLAQTHQNYWRCDIPPIFTESSLALVAQNSVPTAFRRAEVFATFEHFSWTHSSHALACEVVSSFGDRPITIKVHTNVRDHSAAGPSNPSNPSTHSAEGDRPFGQFNNGRKRIKEMAQEHRCTAGCRFLKLPPFVVF